MAQLELEDQTYSYILWDIWNQNYMGRVEARNASAAYEAAIRKESNKPTFETVIIAAYVFPTSWKKVS